MVKHVFNMRKFVITEEQYRAITEQFKPTVNVNDPANGGDPSKTDGQNLDNFNKNAGTLKGKINPVAGQRPSNATTSTTTQTQQVNCGRVITKKQIAEGMLAALKNGTKVYTVKDFLMR